MTHRQAARLQWSRPVPDILALRRAHGRWRINRRRQREALRRRRLLFDVLSGAGYPCGSDLDGAGTAELFARYWRMTGRSRETFYRDLRFLRDRYARHTPDGAAADVSEACACRYFRSVLSQVPLRPTLPGDRAWFWLSRFLRLRQAITRLLPEAVATRVLQTAALVPDATTRRQHPRPQQPPRHRPHAAPDAVATPDIETYHIRF